MAASKKKFNFDQQLMGKKVVVTKYYTRNDYELYKFWEAVDAEEWRQGWIVGYRWLNNGNYIPGSGSGYEADPPGFKVTSKLPTLLVTYWPNEKPIYVPINGYIDVPEDLSRLNYPLYTSSGYGSGQFRKTQLQLMRNYCSDECPRDAKGRFKRFR